jgi:hypothetical protein
VSRVRETSVAAGILLAGLLPCLGMVVLLGQVLRVASETFAQPPGPPLAAPDPATLPAVVAGLGRAATADGSCYGWHLVEVRQSGAGTRSRDVSGGSNLGADVRVTGEPQSCPRWTELRVTMTYAAKSVRHRVTVVTGGTDGPAPSAAQLARLGFDGDAFKAHPAAATLRAVLALPLLTAELRGTAPLPAGTPVASPAPLPAVGGDLWRDRGTALSIAGLLLLAGAAGAGLLLRASRRAAAAAAHAAAVTAARATPRPRVSGPRGHSGNLDALRSARRSEGR